MLKALIDVKVLTNNKALLFTKLLTDGLEYDAVILGDSFLIFTIQKRYLQKFEHLFNSLKLEFFEIRRHGLGHIPLKLINRAGIIIGFLFLIFVVALSSRIVWKINIIGNESYSKDEILSEIRKSGFDIGTYVPGIDYDALHNKILLNSDKLSWISINIRGNTANVYVKERLQENIHVSKSKNNLVAKKDGQIVSIVLKEGKKIVSIGDVVKKGEILISGVLDSQSEGVLYCDADGEVLAYTNESIVVKIPYIQNIKREASRSVTEKKLNILNFDITFFNKSNKSLILYDKIENSKRIELFGFDDLPIFIQSTTVVEYEYIEKNFTKEQVVDLAFVELRGKLNEILNEAEIVDKKINISYDDIGITLKCDLYCIEDIGKKAEIKTN